MNAEWLIKAGNEWWVIIFEWLMAGNGWWMMSFNLWVKWFIVMGDEWWDING